MTIMLTLFTLGVTLIGRSKLPQARLKLLQVQSKLPHLIQWGNFGRTLIQNIVKKIDHHLWKRYRLNANYHIVFSSWGLCDVAYFQNFQKSFKIDQSYPVSWYPPPTQEYCNIFQYKAYYFIIRLYS